MKTDHVTSQAQTPCWPVKNFPARKKPVDKLNCFSSIFCFYHWFLFKIFEASIKKWWKLLCSPKNFQKRNFEENLTFLKKTWRIWRNRAYQIGWPRSNLKMDATLRKWKIAKIVLFWTRCLLGLCHKFKNDQKPIAVRTENIDCCWRQDLGDFWKITPSWFTDKLDFPEFVWRKRFCVKE